MPTERPNTPPLNPAWVKFWTAVRRARREHPRREQAETPPGNATPQT